MKLKDAFPKDSPAVFGDRARIKSSPETEALGLAGLVGSVFGQTTPSFSDVEVIGTDDQDYAINVYFEEQKAGYWFIAALIEFVDHNPGAMMHLEGSPSYTRAADGSWVEVKPKRPWWKFWA